MKKKKEQEVVAEVVSVSIEQPSEKEQLQRLYQELKDRGFNSIGDVENRIAKLN